jgi:hypothetical protein
MQPASTDIELQIAELYACPITWHGFMRARDLYHQHRYTSFTHTYDDSIMSWHFINLTNYMFACYLWLDAEIFGPPPPEECPRVLFGERPALSDQH